MFYSADPVGSALSPSCPLAFLTPQLCLLPRGSCAAAFSNRPLSLGPTGGYRWPSPPKPLPREMPVASLALDRAPTTSACLPAWVARAALGWGGRKSRFLLSLPRLMWVTAASPGTLSPRVRSNPAPAGHLLAHPARWVSVSKGAAWCFGAQSECWPRHLPF